jgi:CheY-like chemotaxis protein
VPEPSRHGVARLHVLIVEDDRDARELLAEYLRSCGASVRTAASTAAALAALQRRGRPDVIISDISLPDEDGYALLARIRQMSRVADVPAIALSGHRADAEERARAGRAGFQAYLEKPVDLEKLSQAHPRAGARYQWRRAMNGVFTK